MKENISEILNKTFENIHPQMKIVFKEIEPGKYEIKTGLHSEEGKFLGGFTTEQTFSHIEDERFLAMAKGSAKGLTSILTDINKVTSFIEGPSMLIIEHVLTDTKLSTIDDFAAKLDSESKRIKLQVQEYLLEEAKKTGCEIDDFSGNEGAFYVLGSFQLCFSFPAMRELGIAVRKLVQNKKNWPLLAHWIKEWAGASRWSMNEAWEDGPIFEELLAYGTFTMMEKELDRNNKPAFWSDLFFIVNICFDFTMNDLKRVEFVTE